jgi:hypothetical protein
LIHAPIDNPAPTPSTVAVSPFAVFHISGLGYIYNRKMDPANTKSAPYGLLTCKPQKFIAYFTVAVGALVIVPNILCLLGIMRMSFYSEF